MMEKNTKKDIIYVSQNEGEISLIEIFNVINKFKAHIVAVILFCTVASIAYTYTSNYSRPPVYMATAYLGLADEHDYEYMKLKYWDGSYTVEINNTGEGLQKKYSNKMTSRLLKKKYFEQDGSVNLKADSLNSLVLNEDSKNKRITVSLTAPAPELLSDLLNDYIDFVNIETVSTSKENIRKKLKKSIEQLKHKLAAAGEHDFVDTDINALKQNIDALSYKLQQLEDDNSSKAIIVEQYATEAYEVQEKKKNFIAIGLISGLFLGLFLAFFLDAIKKDSI